MKNILIIFLSLLLVSAQGQEQATTGGSVSKDGIAYLPAAGDFAIGIDALPYLNYVGNMFNNTDHNTLALGSQNLYFRYHLTDNSAVRVILSINNTVNYNSYYVRDDAAAFADPLSQAKVEDKQTSSNSGYGINIGYQKSRGYGRLRGIYGAQVNYYYNRNVTEYAYGNSITAMNSAPTTAWGVQAERNLRVDGGIQQAVGFALIAGIEYYILPKICIGGELGLGYDLNWGSQSDRKTEKLVGSQVVESNILNSPGDVSHSISTMRPANYGGLYIMFHF